MPGMTIFGRRWNIASDDLFFPGLFELLFRSFWLFPQLFYYVQYQADFQCADVALLHVYYLGFLCMMLAIIAVQFWIVVISSRGTITNTSPRRHINQFLYVRSLLVLSEFAWSVIGIIWLVRTKWDICSTLVYVSVLANIIFCGVAIFFLIIVLIIIFDPISHLPEGDVQRRNILYDRLRTIFFCCYCCLYDGNSRSPHYENSYKQISSLLEMIFRGGDMTPSDVLAGIILLSNKEPDQFNRESLNFRKYQKENRLSKLKIEQIPKWMSINEACHYVRYAIATYSWPYYLYMNNFKGCCKLYGCCGVDTAAVSNLDDSEEGNSPNFVIHGDNKSRHHFKAFKILSGIDDIDLVYANFQNDLFLVPFCIVVDHHKKTVVVTIRGTLSMRDVITDMTADCGYFDVEHLINQPCHIGILNTADNIYNKILSQDLLNETFRKYPSYQLLITGHSLGAGTAVILSLKLKKDYPNIKCIAYSPPGGLISAALAEYTKSFVMSVVLGDDIVPRLSVRSVHNLKADILKEIYKTSLPKYKILWKYSLSYVSDTPTLESNYQENASSEDEGISSNNSNNELDNSLNSVNSRNLLLEYESPDTNQSNNLNKYHELVNIREENEIVPVTDQPTSSTSLAKATKLAIKAESKRIRVEARNAARSSPERINEINDDENMDSISKTKIVALQSAKKMMNEVYEAYPELQLPGNILYIYQIRSNRLNGSSCQRFCSRACCCIGSCSSKPTIHYDSRWATQGEFKKIVLTNRMLLDHFPNTVNDALSYFNTTNKVI